LDKENVGSFREELEKLVKIRFGNVSITDNAENVTHTDSMEKKLVLLFDEITKIDVCTKYQRSSDTDPLSEQVRAYTCRKADDNKLFSLCLMSVLNIQVVDLAIKIETQSGRLCTSVGQLTLLKEDQCNRLFEIIFPKLELTRVAGGKTWPVTKEIILRDLFYLTGGHPRTVDLFLTQLYKSISPVTLHHCIVEIINRNPSFNEPKWDVMQAVLLANDVTAKDFLPGSSRRYEIAIANGELIGSLTSSATTWKPQIAEIFIHKWALQNKSSKDERKREIAIALDKILNIRFNFTPVSLEEVLLVREYILSRLYSSSSLKKDYSRISMRKFYPLARSNKIDRAIDILINAAKPLLYVNSASDDSLPSLQYNCLFKPTNPINAGYDFRIRFSIAGHSKRFIDVFYQVKYSEADSSTSLNSEELLNNFSKCKNNIHPLADGFVVVFMTWRPGGQDFNIPSGSLLLHKQILKDILGPNFSNFIETLTTRPILVNPISADCF
jgi:hypothetical protein